MSKNRIDEPFKRPHRYVMGVLLVFVMFCAMMPYISPSIFMGDIMAAYNVDLGIAGLSMSLQLVMSGVCFFIGSFIEDRLGKLKTIKLAMLALLVGVIVSALAPNIFIFLIARLIAGFGQGLAVGITAFMSTWFEGKELSLMMAFNSMGAAIAIALSVALCRPLANTFGSWQGALWIYAAITAVFTILWLILGKNSPEGEAQEKARAEQAALTGKQQGTLSLALREAQFWKLLVYVAVFIVVDTARATYLPTYMITVKGISEGLATTAISLLSVVGLVGSLLGGLLVGKLRRRKDLMFVGLTLFMVCGLLITFISNNILIVVLCILLGFLYYLPIVSQTTIIIETSMAKNPAMISGAMALTTGTAMLLTLIVSPIFQMLVGSQDMTFAYRVFFAVCIVGIIVLLFVKETGKKRDAQAQAEAQIAGE